MRVSDFQSCTFNLESHLTLFFEAEQQLTPLSYLHLTDQAAVLSCGQEPLTLQNLNHDLELCAADLPLKIEYDHKKVTLFGFRRVDDQLYLH